MAYHVVNTIDPDVLKDCNAFIFGLLDPSEYLWLLTSQHGTATQKTWIFGNTALGTLDFRNQDLFYHRQIVVAGDLVAFWYIGW